MSQWKRLKMKTCEKCNYLVAHCRCPATPGNSPLESGADESTEPTESETPKVFDANQKAIEIENQKFMIRMGLRIQQWKKTNGKTPLPIYKDDKGLYWWANREQRKRIAKRRRAEQRLQDRARQRKQASPVSDDS